MDVPEVMDKLERKIDAERSLAVHQLDFLIDELDAIRAAFLTDFNEGFLRPEVKKAIEQGTIVNRALRIERALREGALALETHTDLRHEPKKE